MGLVVWSFKNNYKDIHLQIFYKELKVWIVK